MQKNKLVVISILAALLVSGALSVAAAQETPQVPPTQPDSIPPSPAALQPSRPVEGDQYAPGIGTATITGPDGMTTTITNVTLPAPIYQTDDGVPAFDANGNGQSVTGENSSDNTQSGSGEVVPIYAINENTADNSSSAATVTAVGLVVAALSMGAVGIVCLSKHQ